MKRKIRMQVLGVALALVGLVGLVGLNAGCSPRLARAAIGAAFITAAIVGTAHVLAHHDAHFHDDYCGHHRRYHDGHYVYHYNGYWEYYDHDRGRWYYYYD
jgi:hypothetical protein